MEKHNSIWPQYVMYILILVLVFFASTVFGQNKIIHFNAGWNEANDVEWFSKLTDIKKLRMDVAKDDCQKKYKIATVPTIILFKDGEEVKRFQADISFKMVATRKEIQNAIDELLMSDF